MNLAQTVTESGTFRPECARVPIHIPIFHHKPKLIYKDYVRPLREPSLRVLAFIKSHPDCLHVDIRADCEMNKDQIVNILRRLEMRELITVTGERRSLRYKVK